MTQSETNSEGREDDMPNNGEGELQPSNEESIEIHQGHSWRAG